MYVGPLEVAFKLHTSHARTTLLSKSLHTKNTSRHLQISPGRGGNQPRFETHSVKRISSELLGGLWL